MMKDLLKLIISVNNSNKIKNFQIHVGYELKYLKVSARYFGVKSSKLWCIWKLIISVKNSNKIKKFQIHVDYELKYLKVSACYFGVKSSKLWCKWKLIFSVKNSTKKVKNSKFLKYIWVMNSNITRFLMLFWC